jgi:glycosyltransferase involved in cell wall biosynthesis
MVSGKIKILKDILLNFLLKKVYKLSYVVESADWLIKWDGKYITEILNGLNLIKSRITTIHFGIRNQIIHFGSVHTLIKKSGIRKVHQSNKVVLTWYHVVPGDKRIKFIPKLNDRVDIVYTSCNLTKNKLIKYGLDKEKIVVIPLGVDISSFKPVSFEEKQKIKKQIGIPLDKVVIGSFQKDGTGWGEGLKPKLIKGPDIFVKTVAKLRKYNPFVLLTGPARGYIKKELEKQGIPYKHFYPKDYKKLSKMYNALDLYIIASRIEGGPKAILESWASGVPVASTKVGMVPDIAKDNIDVLLTEIEDIEELAQRASQVIKNKELSKKLIKNGLATVKDYSWEEIAKRYYNELYSKL